MTEAKPSTGARADCTHCGSVDLDAAPAIPCRTNSPMKEHELNRRVRRLCAGAVRSPGSRLRLDLQLGHQDRHLVRHGLLPGWHFITLDRKSTRLNSSHLVTSYAV